MAGPGAGFTAWMIFVFVMMIGIMTTCGIVTGKMAEKKGYSFSTWFFLGFFLNIWGIIIALVVTPRGSGASMAGFQKVCPYCGSMIKYNAYVCPNCCTALISTPSGVPNPSHTQSGAGISAENSYAKRIECPSCGNLIDNQASRFCPYCGTPLSK